MITITLVIVALILFSLMKLILAPILVGVKLGITAARDKALKEAKMPLPKRAAPKAAEQAE